MLSDRVSSAVLIQYNLFDFHLCILTIVPFICFLWNNLYFIALTPVSYCSGSLTLVTLANPWFLLALVPLFMMLVAIIRYYLGTSVDIRRIEAISKLSFKISAFKCIYCFKSSFIEIYSSCYFKLLCVCPG